MPVRSLGTFLEHLLQLGLNKSHITDEAA